MLKPPRPEDEALRLAAVRALNLLDTPPEERFDRITRTAQRLFDVPVALLTLVDANRQWFKSCQGLSVQETDRDVSFCAHAILSDEPLVISNALLDLRFADNPLVTGEPFIRFYAGQPLHGTGGRRIGTLCIVDRQPRTLSADDVRALADLGHWAETELCSTDLSQALLLLRRSEARHQLLLDLAHQISAEGSAAEVLERALATAVALVEGDDAGIAHWDDERAELVQVASFLPSASNGTALDLGATASGRVAQARASIVVNDYAERFGTRAPAGRTGARAVIAVPFLHEARLLGTLSVSRFESDQPFDQADLASLELLAGIVASALATAEAFERQRQAVDELARLNKVKSDFVSIVSHEFRTPLTGIQGFSEMIRDEELSPDEVREFAADINRDALRLARLINDMLDLDRMESGRMSLQLGLVDLNGIVRRSVELCRTTADTHPVRLELDETLPMLRADSDKLTQILTNLLSNALKYSPAGGEILISTRGENGLAHLSVRDEGIGIPSEALETVFERYARVESGAASHIQGTGLGLPIVRQIAQLHAGGAWAESTLGQGSTIHVQLPLDGPPESA